jgi:hypothetical protein
VDFELCVNVGGMQDGDVLRLSRAHCLTCSQLGRSGAAFEE